MKWYPARVALLGKMAEDMTVAELADWFSESEQCIRQAIKYYGIDFKNYKCGPCSRKKYTNAVFKKRLKAQESIDLFKNQYAHEPINQLLTQLWSKNYEQKATHTSHR